MLRQESLVLDVAGRRAWILVSGKPVDRRAVFLANYWHVVSLVLARYGPVAIGGAQAVKLALGEWAPPAHLTAYHSASQSEYAFTLEPGFTLRLRPRELSGDHVEHREGPDQAQVPVFAPATILVTLDEAEVVSAVEPVSAWLRHLVIREPDLVRAVEDWPRPQVLQRLADMANALGNTPLGRQLDAAARRISGHVVPPSRTGVGTRILIPAALLQQARGTGAPWIDEQTMRLARQRAETESVLRERLAKLPSFRIGRLIANAVEAKAYDAYHSTTMEGYRISPEVVEAIVRGDPMPDGPRDEESLRAAMAVQGYSTAFDHVLDLAKQSAPIHGALVLDLYEDLFRPSVNAGIVSPGQLRGWRTGPVSLTGWRYVPPNAAKLRDLIDGLQRFGSTEGMHPVVRALITHLEFVTIHPFLDGNGRLGRLLMNLVLLQGGLPWVTVRVDERIPFFKSIEAAQVDGDTSPFIRYMWHEVRHAASELQRQQHRSGQRRRPKR